MVDNFNLKNMPERTTKKREYGITMVMDKGLSVREVEDLIDVAGDFIDVVKFGFGTSYVTNKLKDKIKLYKESGIDVYFGGTLFEAFIIRDQFEDYKLMLHNFGLTLCEVSDGSLIIPHERKCELINDLARDFQVYSEVGSKDTETIIPPYKWIELMNKELDAGSSKVIAEARESGTVGIFRGSGEVRSGLVDEILTQIDAKKILWEAPKKQQQVYFIKLLGANVNLGNIAPHEAIPLETIRIGLRADTFSFFLEKTPEMEFRKI